MTIGRRARYAFVSGLLLLASCASKPILLPNAKYNRVGEARSVQDVDACMATADVHLKKTRNRRVIRQAATGALVGAAVGGIEGASRGQAVPGLLAGGAIGGAGGAAMGYFQTPEAAKHNLVNYCLKQKGYAVAGWD